MSCGLVSGAALLDLDYQEDFAAEVDMNVVMTGEGELVEVQATAEEVPFSRASLDDLLGLAAKGIARAPRGPARRGRAAESNRAGPEADRRCFVRWDRLCAW